MSPAQVEVARALVALPSWRWEAGMLVWDPDSGGRQVRVYARANYGAPTAQCIAWRPEGSKGCMFRVVHADDRGKAIPDLTDAATAGVLLGWVGHCKVVALEEAVSLTLPDGWVCIAATLAEACARALIALEAA